MEKIITKRIEVGNKNIEAIHIKLLTKNLILLRASKGFVMCGYLNLNTANKFAEVAVKIKGVTTIDDALTAKVDSATNAAKRLGIYKGQPIKEVLKIIV